MRSVTNGHCRSQISFLRRQFLQDDGLPFGDVLYLGLCPYAGIGRER